MTLVLLTLASVTALALLIVERLRLDRSRENIPLVIAVTGTRGKSTVTRMLASVLRCNGQHVLAKTWLTACARAGIFPQAVEGSLQPAERVEPTFGHGISDDAFFSVRASRPRALAERKVHRDRVSPARPQPRASQEASKTTPCSAATRHGAVLPVPASASPLLSSY
jgi:hypothetical protein